MKKKRYDEGKPWSFGINDREDSNTLLKVTLTE